MVKRLKRGVPNDSRRLISFVASRVGNAAMDIPELANFVPRASTSQAPQFAIDPALADASSSYSGRRAVHADPYAEEDDDGDSYWRGGVHGDAEGDDDDSEDDDSEEETDAEDEFSQQQQQGQSAGAKRTRAPPSVAGGLLLPDGTVQNAHARGNEKGKAKAVDQDADGDDDEEDLG